jgi:hypothetical protein
MEREETNGDNTDYEADKAVVLIFSSMEDFQVEWQDVCDQEEDELQGVVELGLPLEQLIDQVAGRLLELDIFAVLRHDVLGKLCDLQV